MGLDSVELVMGVEDIFNIKIRDNEWIEIDTIESFVAVISRHINFHPNQTCLTQRTFYKLRRSFEMIGDSRNEVLPSSTISHLLPSSDLQYWWSIFETELESQSNIKIPSLHKTDLDKNLSLTIDVFGYPIWKRAKPITQNSLRTFIDWILAINHVQFINPLKVKNRYEIERIIIGVLYEHYGVPIDEIFLKSRIFADFGID